jgi:hypothetical protein
MKATLAKASTLRSASQTPSRAIRVLGTAMFMCCAMSLTGPATADDDRVSSSERASILKALEAAGCTSPREMERDDGGYEVEGARCQDGVFEIKLDRQFKIVSRKRDD